MILSFGSRKKRDIRSGAETITLERMPSNGDNNKKFALSKVEGVAAYPMQRSGSSAEEETTETGLSAASMPEQEQPGAMGIIHDPTKMGSPQEAIQQYKPEPKPSAGALRLPDKIMAILLREEAPDAIWWLQKGTAFAMQKEKFQAMILDKHFRGNKFKSLVRNLHRWGFKRMTCDTSASGKTIAFSHKCFRKDKPELVKLIQITKEKDNSTAAKARDSRRQALQAVLPSAPPTALRLSPSVGPLREEGLGGGVAATRGLLGSPSSQTTTHQQAPSLASLVAAEHHHNLSSHGPESLLHSLSNEWRADRSSGAPAPSGLGGHGLAALDRSQLALSSNREQAALLARMGLPEQDNRTDQMRPSGGLLERQRLGSVLQRQQSEGSAFERAARDQHMRDSVLQQHLAASLPDTTAQARLLLQQRISGRASLTGNVGLFQNQHHHGVNPLLPSTSMSSQLISQLTGAGPVAPPMPGALHHGAATGLENSLLLARRNQASLHQHGSGREGTQRVAPQQDGNNAAALTSEELLYLAELRRRGLE
ncbi:HSF-type DNA-binding [Seminavis robusta]|uniref:HSF-type DNA-binding n=1 Tax=Seminavis robusta TaxID=568900 RepID=A0A9N8HS09_9STRA|nr:HSF-type DNA-binding [Seminavis robusta]|eukprot:Sro1461_g274760.1 HSF-type DNA-binding (538) ;mRNA; r:9221-11020